MRTLLLAALLAAPLSAQAADDTKPAVPPAPAVGIGSEAPNFTLKDQDGKDVTLADFRGKKNVVLAFYVFAFTGG